MKRLTEALFTSLYSHVERACAGDRAAAQAALRILWEVRLRQPLPRDRALRPADLAVRDLATGEAVSVGIPKDALDLG